MSSCHLCYLLHTVNFQDVVLPGLAWRELQKLGDLQKGLGKTLLQMITLVSETFEQRPYSKNEICELLGTTPEELNQVC